MLEYFISTFLYYCILKLGIVSASIPSNLLTSKHSNLLASKQHITGCIDARTTFILHMIQTAIGPAKYAINRICVHLLIHFF
ncbi:hypothetical protein ACJX0J_018127, partial [Zea mays]